MSDHLGTPRLIVDQATGTVAQRIDVDEWGVVTNDTNPGFQPFGFDGGLFDGATGLVRFGARDYDARIGRWTTKDPAGIQVSANVFEFVGIDPENYLDPSGLEKKVAVVDGGGFFGFHQGVAIQVPDGAANAPSCKGSSPSDPCMLRFDFGCAAGSKSSRSSNAPSGVSVPAGPYSTIVGGNAASAATVTDSVGAAALANASGNMGNSYNFFSNNCRQFSQGVFNAAVDSDPYHGQQPVPAALPTQTPVAQ